MITCGVHDVPNYPRLPALRPTFEGELPRRDGMSLIEPSRGAGILLVEGVG